MNQILSPILTNYKGKIHFNCNIKVKNVKIKRFAMWVIQKNIMPTELKEF